ARFAVPPAREIGRLLGLHAMDGVEHDHTLGDLGPVVLEGAAARVAAPDPESRGRHACWFSVSLLVLLDDALQLGGHLGDGPARQPHLAVGTALHAHVLLPPRGILAGEVLAVVAPAALGTLERRAGDGLRDVEQVLHVERGVPAGIVVAVAGHARARG